MLFFNKKFDAASFEKDLEELSEQIMQAQTKILKLDITKRKIRKSIIWYGVMIYVAVFSGIYMMDKHQETRFVALMIGFPVLLVVLVQLNARLFSWLSKRTRTRKVNLESKKKAKLEQVKQEGNYNTANELLSKYGGDSEIKGTKGVIGSKPEMGGSKGVAVGPGPAGPAVNGPAGPAGSAVNGPAVNGPALNRPAGFAVNGPAVNGPVGPNFDAPAGPKFDGPAEQVNTKDRALFSNEKKTVGDRLLDLIVGSDNTQEQYGLICRECFHHNGLAPPGCTDPSTVKYVCPFCGHTNGVDTKPKPEPEQDSPTIDEKNPPNGESKAI